MCRPKEIKKKPGCKNIYASCEILHTITLALSFTAFLLCQYLNSQIE